MFDILNLAHAIGDYAICGEGNVSTRVDEKSFLIKSSGTNLHELTEDDLTLCSMEGKKINESEKKPSIEVSFHAWLLNAFSDINYIAHTHPPQTVKILCSSLHTINEFANNRMFPDQIVRNGVKSCIIPYAAPGIELLEKIKENVLRFTHTENFFPKLILLQNHGIIVAAKTKDECLASTLMCEKSADIFIGSKLLGEINFLSMSKIYDVDECPDENYRRTLYK